MAYRFTSSAWPGSASSPLSEANSSTVATAARSRSREMAACNRVQASAGPSPVLWTSAHSSITFAAAANVTDARLS
ncbi:hypothetical protein [Pseudarthrobacter sp. S9]|uniref:hypothetical protein n=1 Tax=Pseudarthrobacter sp. S9 TaxID=3418421 RepID=UPI003CFFE3C9